MTVLSRAALGRLFEAIGEDAVAGGTVVPASVRDRTLSAALAQRKQGSHIAILASGDAAKAFQAQARELERLFDSLALDDWHLPTAADWTIGELVAHLIAVEEYFGSLLGLWSFEVPVGTLADHRAMSGPTIERYASSAPADVIARWREVTNAVLHALDEPSRLPTDVVFHTLPLRLPNVLVTRAFELWTHADDVRRALAQPLCEPPADHIAVMSSLAVRSTPAGLMLAGMNHDDRRIHIVLTGRGGGAWSVGYGQSSPPKADTVFVTDAVDFCRMAAGRIDLADLDADITGDERFARDICLAAQIFAA